MARRLLSPTDFFVKPLPSIKSTSLVRITNPYAPLSEFADERLSQFDDSDDEDYALGSKPRNRKKRRYISDRKSAPIPAIGELETQMMNWTDKSTLDYTMRGGQRVGVHLFLTKIKAANAACRVGDSMVYSGPNGNCFIYCLLHCCQRNKSRDAWDEMWAAIGLTATVDDKGDPSTPIEVCKIVSAYLGIRLEKAQNFEKQMALLNPGQANKKVVEDLPVLPCILSVKDRHAAIAVPIDDQYPKKFNMPLVTEAFYYAYDRLNPKSQKEQQKDMAANQPKNSW